MRANVRADLGYYAEVPITYWHNGNTEYARVHNAEVVYQYDECFSNPYGLIDGQVLMHHPNWGLFIADTIDFDWSN